MLTIDQWQYLVSKHGDNAYQYVRFAAMQSDSEYVEDLKYVDCTSNARIANDLKDSFLRALYSIKANQ